ncbi:disintegrin and metalloproteinase domain-containing protein 10-like isoform X2 [Orbicella faveolata]|nr:disintegrin and metalloproteinase domain-containing protein 10-like isoform X2 [Orbicella faveolata]
MGHILEGKFDGSFFAFGESFHLEPAERYFHFKTPFHSIIFPASSVRFNSSGIQRKMARVKDLQPVVAQATSKRIRRDNLSNSSLNTCTLHIAADHSFFKHVGSGSESATVAEMVYHVAMTDKSFRATDFNQDGGPGDDIGFVIAVVTVFKDAESEGSLESPQDIGIMPYLVKWSEIDHSAYCLALLFTYRDFSDGALGLAWVAEPEFDTPCGICSKMVRLEEEHEALSLNTALATLLNYGVRLPRKASVITVMHEFGHSFGSEHDPDTSECSPGGRAGNFVMYSRARDGNEPNNFLFSPCSKRRMSPIISTKGPQCFIAHNNGSYCGNKIVEQGEDCDCGRPEECLAVDKCCVARDDTLNIPGCTVREGKQCSSVAGRCCTEECTFIPESQARVCQAETECSLESTCNGMSGRCPEAESKPSNVTCNGGSNTCLHGSCTGSICVLYDTIECECYQNTDQMCHVCCNNSQSVCVSTQEFLGRVILKPPGSTCKSHQGYCDSYGVCVIVDSENELSKLRDTFKRFFSKAAMRDLWSWIKRHWYYVLVIIGSIVLVVVLLKFTSRERTSLLSLARRALLPYIVRNQQHVHLRAPQVSLDKFVDAEEELGNNSGDRNLREADVYESPESRLQALFPDVTSWDLVSAIRHSTSEQAAINRLLAQGYVMTEY